MQRLNLRLKDAWSIAAPFWRSEERWRAWGLLAAIVVLNLALVGITVLLTYWQKAFYNALDAKDWPAFISLMLWWRDTAADGFTPSFALLAAAFVPCTAYALYLRQALQIRWRRWLTDKYVKAWLADSAFYRIALTDGGTDNPDQRIAEDARVFVDNSLILGVGILRSIVALVSFVFVLWSLSGTITLAGMTVHGYLVWAALLYSLIGSVLTHVLGKRLIPLNFQEQKVEADFRFGLMRCHENAEGIALSGGEQDEEQELSRRFVAILGNWRGIMKVTRDLTFFTAGFGQFALLFPLAVVAPAYFAGRMTLGGIFQTANAFTQVQGALSWIVDNYSALTAWLATVERLAGFARSIEAARTARDGPSVSVGPDGELTMSGVALSLPGGLTLLRDAHARVRAGERILLVGPSGCGKSTLFRAIAGIWPFGGGKVRRSAQRHLFMPQRPYIPLGTLKRAACFPLGEHELTDQQVASALVDAGLGHLADRLADTDSWERRLSGGEKQRLALARALLVRPDWLFMDEATASLDPAAEDALYTLLRERLPHVALLSIAHRPTVARFHDRILRFERGTLQLGPSAEPVPVM